MKKTNEIIYKYPLKIKAQLKIRDISINEFAEKLGVSPRTINNYLAGFTTPDITTFLHIGKILRISIFDLLEDDYYEFKQAAHFKDKYLETLEENRRKQSELIDTQRKLLNLIKMSA